MEQEDVWDAIAGKWADFRQRITPEVLDFLKNKSGKVLDLGCGSGRNFVDGFEMYGVDFSAKLLEIAKNEGYVELKKAEVFEIPYDDKFFDYIVFSRVLHCVDSTEKRKKTLREIYRVLNKGGEALVTSWGTKGRERLKGEKEGFVSWDVDGEKILRYTYIYDVDELRSELESCGFKILKEWDDWNVGFVVGK